MKNSITDSTVESFLAQEIPTTTETPWQRLQRGDNSAAGEFLTEMAPTITKAVNSYASGDKIYFTKARILALDAAKSYDPSKGANISTHVFNQLRQLQRIAAQRGNLTKVSENVAQQRATVQRAIRELTADLGDDPTTEQIADRVGMSVKRIDALMNHRPVVPESIAVNPEGDSFVPAAETKALELYDTVIYNELDNIDKKIYEWSTGYGKGEKLSGAQIAQRLKITPAAVSKRYAKIVQKFGADRDLIKRTIIDVGY
jgi:RNA polymerase primary sigma factor